MKIFPSVFLLILPAAFSVSMLDAAPQKTNLIFQPTITAVGQDGITVLTGRNAGLKVKIDGVTQQASNVKKYRVIPSTTITIDGLPGTLEQLKKGMAVSVEAGMDQGAAESIVANTIADPLPPPAPGGKGNNVGQSSTHETTRVVAVASNSITIGYPGAKASAYLVTDETVIAVNGVPAKLLEITKGMSVMVSSDGRKATRISAQDVKKNLK